MATYEELKAQGEALLAQAEEMRKQEKAAVVAEIKSKMKEFGLSVADLGFGGSQTKPKVKNAGKSDSPAKYRGPNGELWAGGLGRKPAWVKAALDQGKSLDEFLIGAI